MTDIVTLTVNPAIDTSTTVDRIAPIRKLRCTAQLRYPGGGGINVARVIKRLGGDAIAVYPAGGANGALLRQLMTREGVGSHTWRIAAETREDFFVTETSSGQPYRFILPGPSLDPSEWQEGLDLIAGLNPFPRFVVASGSLPADVPLDFYVRVSRIAKQRGAMMVLDTSGPPLAMAVAEGLDLIKPNLREMGDLIGRQPADAAEWTEAARELVQTGKANVVALTMAHLGATLVARDLTLRARPVSIAPLSATGAGDSFLGALIWRLAAGHDLKDAFCWAAAAGAAALLHPGTELCRPDDVERLVAQTAIDSF
jgi:6-phosphofructokinase 2